MSLSRDQILHLAKIDPETLADYVIELQDLVLSLKKEVESLGFLADEVKTLRDQVADLKSKLNKNSRNSSKPPSSDGLKKPKKRKSLRKKSGKKPGGQPGHTGHTLERVENPDRTIPLPFNVCSCGVDLTSQKIIGTESRQVFELPKPKLIVTEYQAEIKKCPCCGRTGTAVFPEGISAPAQYGNRLKAFSIYLNQQHFLPTKRISQLLHDLFGYRVSEGVVYEQIRTLNRNLGHYEADVVEGLKAQAVLNVDETGLNVIDEGKWLHSASTDYLTFYGIHPNRGRKAMNDFGIIPDYKGILVHDFYPSYLTYECDHALCNAHLLRELKFLVEERDQQWAKKMSDLLLDLNRFVDEQRGSTNKLTERQKKPWLRRYRNILSQGEKACPIIENQNAPPKRGRKKRSIEQNLLKRFQNHETSILRFMHDFRVPFTNNLAEQDIRMMKVRQKISGCFRTTDGAKSFARIRGYLSTCRKNGSDLLQSITDALKGNVELKSILA